MKCEFSFSEKAQLAAKIVAAPVIWALIPVIAIVEMIPTVWECIKDCDTELWDEICDLFDGEGTLS